MSWLDNMWIQLLLGALAGYFIGAIPFGYLVYRGATGTDIRTVGSGNIGATNVGRLLGFRYFLLIFTLDVLKGFAPVLGVPLALRSLGATPPADLRFFIALAAILGHNFPVYLGFKGGKGVATSLGALLALEPLSCAAAAAGFFLVFLSTRYVSLSSIAGALAFVAGHFAIVRHPWSKENFAMSLLAISIAGLLIVRHRKNLGRIAAGTEPKVPLRRPRKDRDDETRPGQPGGWIHPLWLVGLAAAVVALSCAALWVAHRARAPIEVTAGPWTLRETHRELTGQQRSTRVLFTERGRKLAVMCPRYNKVLLYHVTARERLEPAAEIALQGRPVAMAAAGGTLVILQRPPGDDKHLGPGWWEAVTLDGARRGPRVPAGYYPDDLAITPDGRFLLVLSSGQAEGDRKKPLPGLEVYRVDSNLALDRNLASDRNPESASNLESASNPESAPNLESQPPSPIGRLSLEPTDDADRLILSSSGTRGLITLPKARQAVAFDLTRPENPTIVGRQELTGAGAPYVSRSADGDWIVMPTVEEHEAVLLPASTPSSQPDDRGPAAGYLVYTLPEQSALELAQAAPRFTLGRFPLKGPLNLGGTRPSGLALCAERGLIAVATKPGTVHVVSIRSRLRTDSRPRCGRASHRGLCVA